MRRISRTISCSVAIGLLLAFNAGAQSKDSLTIKIGQMILVGFAGTSVEEAVLNEVREGKVGSIILFEKNIPPQNSFVGLKKIIWTYQQAAPIPLARIACSGTGACTRVLR